MDVRFPAGLPAVHHRLEAGDGGPELSATEWRAIYQRPVPLTRQATTSETPDLRVVRADAIY